MRPALVYDIVLSNIFETKLVESAFWAAPGPVIIPSRIESKEKELSDK
jgi:hypothetical protein